MPSFDPLLAVAPLTAAAVFSRQGPVRRLLALSATMLAMGIAALRAAPAPIPPLSLRIDMALVVLGILLALAAAVMAVRGGRAAAPRPWPPAAGIASRSRLLAAAAIGAAVTVVGLHLYIVLAGALLAALAGAVLTWRRRGAEAVPLLPILAVPALLFVAWYMTVIAAPTGLSIAALHDGPFSPAAEAMLLLPLGIAAAGFFAPWPFARMLPGPALSVVGVALLMRLGHGALPGALDAWRTVFIPLAVVALWGAAMTRRVRHAAAAAAWMACFAAPFGGERAAWLLAAALVTGGAADLLPAGRGSVRTAALALAAAAGAVGAAYALLALLQSEVVYAVLAWAAAIALAAMSSRGSEATEGSARTELDAGRADPSLRSG